MEHRLAVKHAHTPIKQKPQQLSKDRFDAIEAKVEKLTKAGIICHVWHSKWLNNPILVKKANDKWHMSMDFTDINKASSKDDYPLPCIDQLVDSMVGCGLLSFMDTCSGYHQVHMPKEVKLKTSFATPKGRTTTSACLLA